MDVKYYGGMMYDKENHGWRARTSRWHALRLGDGTHQLAEEERERERVSRVGPGDGTCINFHCIHSRKR